MQDSSAILGNFIVLTEIRNAFSVIEPDITEEEKTGAPFIIRDDIVFEYEDTIAEASNVKMHQANKDKLAKQIKQAQFNESVLREFDVVGRMEIQDKIADLRIQDQILDAKAPKYDMETITRRSTAYLDYKREATAFLQRHDFFKQNEQTYLKPEHILTREKYNTYLSNLFEQIKVVSRWIVNDRFNTDSPSYYKNEFVNNQEVALYSQERGVGLGDCFGNLDYYQRGYKFHNTVDESRTERKFVAFVKQMYLLSLYIEETNDFLNTIFNNYMSMQTVNSFYDVMMKNRLTDYAESKEFNVKASNLMLKYEENEIEKKTEEVEEKKRSFLDRITGGVFSGSSLAIEDEVKPAVAVPVSPDNSGKAITSRDLVLPRQATRSEIMLPDKKENVAQYVQLWLDRNELQLEEADVAHKAHARRAKLENAFAAYNKKRAGERVEDKVDFVKFLFRPTTQASAPPQATGVASAEESYVKVDL
jgi:hypothetical protein